MDRKLALFSQIKYTSPLKIISLAVLLGISLALLASVPLKGQTPATSNFTPLQFVENKGQWKGDFLYRTDLGNAYIQLKKNGFTFLMLDKDDMEKLSDRMHGHAGVPHNSVDYDAKKGDNPGVASTNAKGKPGAGPQRPAPVVKGHVYTVSFLNASPNPAITPDKPVEGYSNYIIGNDSAQWQSNVKSYQAVMYKSLYSGIDMQVYSEASLLKYDLIVHPGADPSQVLLQYEGVDKLELKKGQLEITTSVGKVTELMPYAYQYVNNQRVPVKVSYRLDGNKVGFRISGKYDPQYPLVIDPSYVFSVVSGARADNWGFTATYDAQGNFYGGGITFDPGNYPVTPGAVQNAFQGGTFDMGITKWSANGRNIIYSTYIGGNGLDQPHSLFVDTQGNLIISGRTNSSNFPFTRVEGTRGGWDIAVTKINAAGTARIGSICLAGSSDDGVNMRDDRELGDWVLLRNYGDDARSEVVCDEAGNIYVASCTRSGNFPATGGTFQPGFGGMQDGVVMRLSPDCSSLVWASFIGGSREDAAYVLALNGNTLYVAGGTASNDFRTTPGVVYGSYRGGVCDGFIAHINIDGTALLQSTFLGADNVAADQVYGIQMDARGFVYVMGTTEGNWPIRQPTGTGSFYNDNSKQFIAKLQPNLSAFVYSTTFGKQAADPSISPVAFLVDKCENVYVSGWGGGINIGLDYPNSGTSGLPTRSALLRTTDNQDFYFFVLQRDATDILFGSFFGGVGLSEHVDGGTSRFDRNGVIYQGICAWCNNGQNPKPRYPIIGSGSAPPECNLGALKIAFNLDGVKAGIKTLDRKRNYCVPATITFVDTTGFTAQSRTWNFGDGSPEVTGNLDTVTHTYANTGNYRVRLVKCDPASCNGCDTAYTDVQVREDRAELNFTATRLQPCEALSYQFTNASVEPAGKPFTNTSFILDYGDGTPPAQVGLGTWTHNYAADGIYNATLTLVDTNYCNAPDTDTIPLRVAANVVASFEMNGERCAPATIEFNNTTRGGETFTWDFGDGSPVSTDIYPVHVYQNPGTYTVTLHAVDNSTCNIEDDTTATITISGAPTAAFSFTPTKPEENTPVSFVNESIGAVSYHWEFGDGATSDQTNPVHQYNSSGTYNVCLYATNAAGCTDSACSQVAAIVIPLFDVPNAFSPNQDGMNDVLLVRGFGIAKFNMKIFNRWGQLVFESNDASIGWDGRFKGAIQPMDAYAYTVYLEFSDGTKANRSGSITLLK
jgi:gliding motility-associated-like protein